MMEPVFLDEFPVAYVDCASCTLCCQTGQVYLQPEKGEKLDAYPLKHETTHPTTGKPVWAIDRREDGTCAYLGDDGCRIHGHHPMACRDFDCAKLASRMGRADRRRLAAMNPEAAPIIAHGVHRLRIGRRALARALEE